MGNTHTKPHPRPRNKKQVHWKAADRPSAPGKPHLSPDSDISPDLVTICWSKPSRDGGSPITGYLVEHRRSGTPHWVRSNNFLVPFPELSITGLEPGWRYQFRVRAENAVGLSDPGDISEPLTVTLQKHSINPPKFFEELKDITALENNKVEFIVHFLGQPPPKICWYKDGFEIFSSRRTRILTESDKSVLTIHQVALADEGEIKCSATNKAGHAATKAKLTLEAPPSIRLPRQYEDGLLFEIGEVIRLKISVAGRPTPLIFWSHNGETIQNDDRYEIEHLDKSSVLKISEARREDRGEYQIKAVNKVGEDVTAFLVTITDKPSPPGRARVVMTLGRSVTLSWGTPFDDGGCKIGNYIIEYYRLGWNVWLKAATSRQLSTILGDLIEGSEYKFRVKAESPYGVSEPSEESETIFIPDPRRGLVNPQPRSRSQDIIEEITAPVATKRRSKSRSQSSSGKVDAIFYDEVENLEPPKRPERQKIKSPPKTPDVIRKHSLAADHSMHQTILDRASIARDLAYGSPEIKIKKTELTPMRYFGFNSNSSGSEKSSLSPSPSSPRSPSPAVTIEEKTPSPVAVKKAPQQLERTPISRENSENIDESSEFMLVIYPEASEKGAKKMREFEFDFDEISIPPPISLSAPELGVEPPIFENLKLSASSTELLHERAFMRFREAAAAEEAAFAASGKRKISYDGQHTIEIPKIQINSKDDDNIVGLERRNSLRRRQSAGGVVQQQILWAQRRFSLRNSQDFNDILENKLQKHKSVKLSSSNDDKTHSSRRESLTRQRSESEEKEEEEFERVRAKMAVTKPQTSFEKRQIPVVDEEKWLEEYEESLSEEETESESEDEPNFRRQEEEETTTRRVYSDTDEETYHPGMMMAERNKSGQSSSEEPFEILTKKNKLPDPNFKPKSILKKGEENIEIGNNSRHLQEPMVKSKNIRTHSPMPQHLTGFNGNSKKPRQRSFSLAFVEEDEKIKSNSLPIGFRSKKSRQRSSSLSAKEAEDLRLELRGELSKSKSGSIHKLKPTHSVSAGVQIGAMTAASIVIPKKLQAKKKDEEEVKVVADHYADIVRTVSQKKRGMTPEKPDWRSSEEKFTSSISSLGSSEKSIYNEPKFALQERRASLSRNQHQPDRKLEDKPARAQDDEENGRKSSISINGGVKTEEKPKPQTISDIKRSPTPQRSRPPSRNQNRRNSASKRSKTPLKSAARLENWDEKASRKSKSPSPMRALRRNKSPSPIPYSKTRPMLREIMTQTSVGLEWEYSSDSRTSTPAGRSAKQEELIAKAEVKVRSTIDYITDLAMFCVACWLYIFSNELLAVPVLLVMVYRQLQSEIRRRIPKWILRRLNRKKAKRNT